MFKTMVSLQELWLESNQIVSVDKNSLVGLNKLEKVCINNNPISTFFPHLLDGICSTNSKCVVSIAEKCILIIG